MENNLTQKEALDMLQQMNIEFTQRNLVWFSQEEDLKKVELMLIAGGNPNGAWVDESGFGHYPMMKASIKGNVKLIELLLEYGANLNKPFNNNVTALIYAINNDQTEAAKYLIEKGADVNLKTTENSNALHYAKRKKNDQLINLLRAAGSEEIAEEEIKPVATNSTASTNSISEGKKNQLIGAIAIFAIVILVYAFGGGGSSSSSGGSSSSSGSSVSHSCLNCGKSYSGYGYATIGGEEYALDKDQGDQYCSSSCAKASRTGKFRNL